MLDSGDKPIGRFLSQPDDQHLIQKKQKQKKTQPADCLQGNTGKKNSSIIQILITELREMLTEMLAGALFNSWFIF